MESPVAVEMEVAWVAVVVEEVEVVMVAMEKAAMGMVKKVALDGVAEAWVAVDGLVELAPVVEDRIRRFAGTLPLLGPNCHKPLQCHDKN